VVGHELAQPHEGVHDMDAHLRGGVAVEDVGGLKGTVFSHRIAAGRAVTTAARTNRPLRRILVRNMDKVGGFRRGGG
jgi:hypothetical protein